MDDVEAGRVLDDLDLAHERHVPVLGSIKGPGQPLVAHEILPAVGDADEADRPRPPGGRAGQRQGVAAALGVGPTDALDGFLKTLEADAATTQSALRLVLGQPGISSQMVDNLNASIHVRALLTDVFIVDEILKSGKA